VIPAAVGSPAEPAAPGVGGRLRSLLLAAAVALAFADASIVVLALPPIYGEFETTIVGVSWVITVYAVVVAVAGLALALSRSRRRPAPIPATPVLRIGMVLFATSSVVCGLAPSMAWLIAGRCGQGIGGTLLLSGALGVLEFEDGRRPGYRTWSLAATVGLAVGPALGGVLTQVFDWQAIFLAQAPVALAALLVGAGRSPTSGAAATVADEERTDASAAAWWADGALVLVSAALVGALFLGVLLVIEVWRYSPIAGAVVVSALPAAVFAVRPLASRAGPAPAGARVAAGCVTLAAGLAGLAFLPAASGWWAAAALAVCGAGFGLADPVIGTIAETAGLDPVRTAARTVAARHAGLVLGLVVIAPALASDLDAGAERAVIAGADTMLDARLPVQDKIGVAGAVAEVVDDTPRGKMPDIGDAFVRADVTGDDADRAAADLVGRIEDVLTRSFRRVFLMAAGLALAALLPALAAVRGSARAREPAAARPPRAAVRSRWLGAAALVAVLGAGGGLLAAAAGAGAGDLGEVVEADACTSSPDPYPGDGLDATLQRIALGGLNGAACDLDVSRERLVLSLAEVPGMDTVPLDSDRLDEALEAGLVRAIDDADDRDGLPGWAATALRFVARNAPISWLVDGFDLDDRLPG